MNSPYEGSVLMRFWSYVSVGPENECWLWRGRPVTTGYGRMRVNGKCMAAHRLSYVIHYGEIPEGLLVCHHCDVPLCVNPGHLYAGTNLQNRQDAVDRGRVARGLNNGAHTYPEKVRRGGDHVWYTNPEANLFGRHSGMVRARLCGEQATGRKLTWEQVDTIRELRGHVGPTEMGRRFNVHKDTISRIWAEETWRPEDRPNALCQAVLAVVEAGGDHHE